MNAPEARVLCWTTGLPPHLPAVWFRVLYTMCLGHSSAGLFSAEPCAVGAQTYFFYGSTAISQLFHHVHVTGIPYGQKCAPCDTYDATHDATHTA
jgi:hypothetical protein